MHRTGVIILGIAFAILFLLQRASGQESSGNKELQIVESKLGSNVQDRSLLGEDTVFVKGSKVYFWMKISGGNSDQITVTWKTGDYSHSTTLVVGGNPWRTWATKTVGIIGEWIVTVKDETGNNLEEVSFKVK